jgi:hypothetical protein
MSMKNNVSRSGARIENFSSAADTASAAENDTKMQSHGLGKKANTSRPQEIAHSGDQHAARPPILFTRPTPFASAAARARLGTGGEMTYREEAARCGSAGLLQMLQMVQMQGKDRRPKKGVLGKKKVRAAVDLYDLPRNEGSEV